MTEHIVGLCVLYVSCEQPKAQCILKTRIFQLEVIEILSAYYYLIPPTVITRGVKAFLEMT